MFCGDRFEICIFVDLYHFQMQKCPARQIFSSSGTFILCRFVELEREMTTLAGSMADLQSELAALRDDKEMLLLRNQSLEEELQKQKLLVALHHKQQAITLHHAHHHNMTCPHHHAWWLVDKSNYEVMRDSHAILSEVILLVWDTSC